MRDLSIIIVNYNKAELLKQCLESIYDNLSQNITYEVIVVDNASQDQSVALIKDAFPHVTIIQNDHNRGFAAGNNQGLRIAQGKYIILLNNDTFVLANALEQLIKFLHENPMVGAVGPALLNADGYTIQVQGSGRGEKFWLATRPTEVSFLTGAAFMIRRELLEDVGELDENFFFYNEDLDWCRRIIAKKWKIFYLPQAKIIHYGGQSTTLNSVKAHVEGFRGGMYFCSKYYRSLFILYRLLMIFLCLCALTWYGILLLVWTKKRTSFMMLQAYVQIMMIAAFWRHHLKNIRKQMLGVN